MAYYTYILGAGASFDAIPTIDKLDDDIKAKIAISNWQTYSY